MAQDVATSGGSSDCEVMASIDHSTSGERFIIAELCRENAYLSIEASATVDVTEWR